MERGTLELGTLPDIPHNSRFRFTKPRGRNKGITGIAPALTPDPPMPSGLPPVVADLVEDDPPVADLVSDEPPVATPVAMPVAPEPPPPETVYAGAP